MNDDPLLHHPDWQDDLAEFRQQLEAAPTITRPFDPLIAAAARQARITLTDGTTATLIGIPHGKGRRARIELPGGRQRTIPLDHIAHIHPSEEQ